MKYDNARNRRNMKVAICGGIIIIIIILAGLYNHRTNRKKISHFYDASQNGLQDWAKSGTVQQSSTYHDANENDVAQRAIDGNEATYSATTWEVNPWWQVILPQSILIDNITIVPRPIMSPLNNFTITITNEAGTIVKSIINTNNVISSTKVFPDLNVVANKVRIAINGVSVLNMAEFKVFGTVPGQSNGKEAANSIVLLNSIAVATQSSNIANGINLAPSALIGNTSKTNPELSWWQATFPDKTYIDHITIAAVATPDTWYGIHYINENGVVIKNEGHNSASLAINNIGLIVNSIRIYRPSITALELTNVQIFGYPVQTAAAPAPGNASTIINERHIKYGDIVLMWAWNSNYLFARDNIGAIVAGGPRATPDSIENNATAECFTFENINSTGGLNGAINVINSGDVVLIRTWNLLYFEILSDKLTLNSVKSQATPFIISKILLKPGDSKIISYGDSIAMQAQTTQQYINIPKDGGLYSATSFSPSIIAISTFIIYDRYGNNADVNWARQGIPTMSSTASPISNTAISAINGSTSDYTLSNMESQPWWQVALPQDIFIEKFMMSNRQDAYQERLVNFDVFFYDANGAQVGTFYFLKSQPSYVIPDINISARVIKIALRDTNYLSISSVKIYGQPTNLVKNIDWAKTGTPTMSSDWTGSWDKTLPDYHAINAIDGNANTFSMTQPELRPWWQIKLIKQININKIIITNRRDCCQNRLADFNVLLYDDAMTLVNTIYQKEALPTYVFSGININARYVKIMLNGTDWLQITEVNIFGQSAPELSTAVLYKKLSTDLTPDKNNVIKNADLPMLPNGSMAITFDFIINSDEKNVSIFNKNLMPFISIHDNKLMLTITTKNGNVNILTNADITRNINNSIAVIIKSKISQATGWEYINDNNNYYFVNDKTNEYYETDKLDGGGSGGNNATAKKLPADYKLISKLLTNDSTAQIYLNSQLVQSKKLESLPVYNTEDIKIFTPDDTKNVIANITWHNNADVNLNKQDYSGVNMNVVLVSNLKTDQSVNVAPDKLPTNMDKQYSISFWFKPLSRNETYYTINNNVLQTDSNMNLVRSGKIITKIPTINIWYKYDEIYEKGTIKIYLNNVLVLTTSAYVNITGNNVVITGAIYEFSISNYPILLQEGTHPEQDKITKINNTWATDLKCPNSISITNMNNHALFYSNDITESLYELKAADKDYSLCYGTVAGKLIAKYEKKELAKDPNYVKTEEQNAKLLEENKKLTTQLISIKTPTTSKNNEATVVLNLLAVKKQLSANAEYQALIKDLQTLVARGHLLTSIIQPLNSLANVDIETNTPLYQTFKSEVMMYINLRRFAAEL